MIKVSGIESKPVDLTEMKACFGTGITHLRNILKTKHLTIVYAKQASQNMCAAQPASKAITHCKPVKTCAAQPASERDLQLRREHCKIAGPPPQCRPKNFSSSSSVPPTPVKQLFYRGPAGGVPSSTEGKASRYMSIFFGDFFLNGTKGRGCVCSSC